MMRWTVVLVSGIALGCGDPTQQLMDAVDETTPDDSFAMGLVPRLDAAAEAVNRAGRAAIVVGPLAERLRDHKQQVRINAARALGMVDADEAEVAAALVQAMADESPNVRWQVAESLGSVESGDAAAVAALVELLKDDDPAVRSTAADSLGRIGPRAEQGVPGLIEALGDAPIAWHAAGALGEIGPAAGAAEEALTVFLEGASGYERLAAAEAVWRIGGEVDTAVAALVALLEDEFLSIRRDAAHVLGAIGPAAHDAIPALDAAVAHRPVEVADRPPVAGQPNDGPVLLEMSEAEFYPQVAEAAAKALRQIRGAR